MILEFPETAECDSACCASHEKVYFKPSKNQFLRSKFFLQKFRGKKFL